MTRSKSESVEYSFNQEIKAGVLVMMMPTTILTLITNTTYYFKKIIKLLSVIRYKPFVYTVSFHSAITSERTTLLSSFYRWENWAQKSV